MDFDLFSCTFENLNSLKFNELQKLSSQYRVNKRWAKKREIIDKLLILRDEEIRKRDVILEKKAGLEENEQWMDGNKVFPSTATDQASNNKEIERRLTYNVNHSNEEILDRRLTFSIVTEEASKISRDVNIEISDNIDRRLTYNADEIKGIQKSIESIKETSDTENENKNSQVSVPKQETKHHAAIVTVEDKGSSQLDKLMFPQNEKSNLNKKEAHADKKGNETLSTSQNHIEKSIGLRTKMLTIPYSKIPAHSRKSGTREVKEFNEGKALAPNRPLTTKCNINKAPQSILKQISLTNKFPSTTKSFNSHSNGPSTLKSNLYDTSVKAELSTLDNTRRILPRRKSKTEDNVLVTNLKSSTNLKFFSPTESNLRNHKRLSDMKRVHPEINLRSKIPKAKAIVEPQKPVTAKKMPDFSKIHQRQFEQMDSLLDYKRKKEERARKLFGISQPGIPVKVNKGNTSTTLYEFKSSHNEKENLIDKTSETMITLNQNDVKHLKGKPNRQDLMNRAISKSNIVKNVKEQNRKHLNGVRTNKRFELQMKYRKM